LETYPSLVFLIVAPDQMLWLCVSACVCVCHTVRVVCVCVSVNGHDTKRAGAKNFQVSMMLSTIAYEGAPSRQPHALLLRGIHGGRKCWRTPATATRLVGAFKVVQFAGLLRALLYDRIHCGAVIARARERKMRDRETEGGRERETERERERRDSERQALSQPLPGGRT
jgi:hypothetical protein